MTTETRRCAMCGMDNPTIYADRRWWCLAHRPSAAEPVERDHRCAVCNRPLQPTTGQPDSEVIHVTDGYRTCPEHRAGTEGWQTTTETTETRPAAVDPFVLTGDDPPQHTAGCLCFLSGGGNRPHLARLADGYRLIVRRDPGSTGGAWLELLPPAGMAVTPDPEPTDR